MDCVMVFFLSIWSTGDDLTDLRKHKRLQHRLEEISVHLSKVVWSKLLALYSLDDAHSWALDNRSLDSAPHLAHCSKKTFRLVYAVEFEVDDGVVGIVNRP